MIGKTLLAGVTFVDADGEMLRMMEVAGTVLSVDEVVAVDQTGDDEPFTLPADPEAYEPAEPGHYRLRSTGQVVINPDYLTTWTVTSPPGADHAGG